MPGYYINAVGETLYMSGASTSTYVGTSATETWTGTDANETFRGGGGQDTYSGGNGDDTYILWGSQEKVIESQGGGIDTEIATQSRYLDPNVENLTLQGNQAVFGGGNDLDNIITGSSFDNVLDGGKGNDVLIGGGGNDTFVVTKGDGSDLITDFSAKTDMLQVGGYGYTTFDQIKSIIKQVGADTQLQFDNGEKLVLQNVDASTLTAANFHLELDRSSFKLTLNENFNENNLSLYSQGGLWQTEFNYGGPGSLASHTFGTQQSAYMDPTWAGTGTTALGVNPFSLNNGQLTITAAPTTAAVLPYVDGHSYTSGVLTTYKSFSQEYGYFEMRAKLPEGQGMYSAFWITATEGLPY